MPTDKKHRSLAKVSKSSCRRMDIHKTQKGMMRLLSGYWCFQLLHISRDWWDLQNEWIFPEPEILDLLAKPLLKNFFLVFSKFICNIWFMPPYTCQNYLLQLCTDVKSTWYHNIWCMVSGHLLLSGFLMPLLGLVWMCSPNADLEGSHRSRNRSCPVQTKAL